MKPAITCLLVGLSCLQTQANEIADFENAAAAARTGKFRMAAEGYEAILKKNPKARETCRRLAWILATCPDATVRDGKRAVVLAEKFPKLPNPTEYVPDGKGGRLIRIYIETGGYPIPSADEILAAAHAEAGEFKTAIRLQRKCLRGKKAGENKPGTVDTVKLGEERLALYEANQAFHTPK